MRRAGRHHLLLPRHAHRCARHRALLLLREPEADGVRHGRQLLGGDRLEDRRELSRAGQPHPPQEPHQRAARPAAGEVLTAACQRRRTAERVPGRSRPAVRRGAVPSHRRRSQQGCGCREGRRNGHEPIAGVGSRAMGGGCSAKFAQRHRKAAHVSQRVRPTITAWARTPSIHWPMSPAAFSSYAVIG